MKWELEPDIREKSVKAFLDLAILCRLSGKPMSGYQVTSLLIRETGIPISPSAIYHALYSMEINGLIKCVRKKPGRAYILTSQGQKITEAINETQKEIQAFLRILLSKQNANLLTKIAQQ